MTLNEEKSGTLIGIGGQKRAGKDAFARFVAETNPDRWEITGMSVALFRAALVIDPIIELPREFQKRWANRLVRVAGTKDLTAWDALRPVRRFRFLRLSQIVAAVGETAAKEVPDVRQFLQRLGTDVGRRMFDENVWVDLAAQCIVELQAAGKSVVITGIRFPNELRMVQELGGSTFHVSRPSLTADTQSSHESEHALTADDFEHRIVNDGTLDDLRMQALSWVLTR